VEIFLVILAGIIICGAIIGAGAFFAVPLGLVLLGIGVAEKGEPLGGILIVILGVIALFVLANSNPLDGS